MLNGIKTQLINKHSRNPKGQSRIDNTETQATPNTRHRKKMNKQNQNKYTYTLQNKYTHTTKQIHTHYKTNTHTLQNKYTNTLYRTKMMSNRDSTEGAPKCSRRNRKQ